MELEPDATARVLWLQQKLHRWSEFNGRNHLESLVTGNGHAGFNGTAGGNVLHSSNSGDVTRPLLSPIPGLNFRTVP